MEQITLEQIMGFLKANQQKMDANKAESKAERKADREMMAEMKTQIDSLAYEMKADQREMKADQRKMMAKMDKMDANQYDMKATIRSGQEEMIKAITGGRLRINGSLRRKDEGLAGNDGSLPRSDTCLFGGGERINSKGDRCCGGATGNSPRERLTKRSSEQLRTELVNCVWP
jgi:hypothetical protein